VNESQKLKTKGTQKGHRKLGSKMIKNKFKLSFCWQIWGHI